MRLLFLKHSPGVGAYDPKVIEQKLQTYASPGTTVEVQYPEHFPGDLNPNYSLLRLMTLQTLAAKALWAEQNGYDAVIQSNGYDPGVDAGRYAVRIPVIGMMRTAIHFALTLADRVGVTAFGPTERRVWTILRAYGVQDSVTGVRQVHGEDLASVWHRTHADENKGPVLDGLVKAVKELVSETGAEIIVPLGGLVIPYMIDPLEVQEATGVQVLNTKAIGVHFAETCVKLGISHSAITYPHVPLTARDFEATGASS